MNSNNQISDHDQFFTYNGTKICFRIYGDPSLNRAVFYFHGLPGSRLEASLTEKNAAARGLSVIAVDRPGIGGSEYTPRTSPASWPPVIKALAAHLGIKRFQIFALSGGGSYALATAQALPNFVQGGVLVSCALPFGSLSGTEGMIGANRIVLELIRNWPRVGRMYVSLIALVLRYFPVAWLTLLKLSSKADRLILRDPALASLMKENFKEAVRLTSKGSQDEVSILAQNEILPTTDITASFTIYHGSADAIVPLSAAHRLKELLPQARLNIFPDEGHFLVVPRIDEILDVLAADNRR